MCRRPVYRNDEVAVPAISVSAVRDRAGQVHVALVNLDPHRAITTVLNLAGMRPGAVSGRIVTGPAMDAHNDFDHPDVVRPAAFTGARVSGASGDCDAAADVGGGARPALRRPRRAYNGSGTARSTVNDAARAGTPVSGLAGADADAVPPRHHLPRAVQCHRAQIARRQIEASRRAARPGASDTR